MAVVIREPGRVHLILLLACSAAPAGQGVSRPEPTPAPVVASAAAHAPLFGFWGMNGFLTPDGLADVQRRTNLTVIQTASREPAWAVGTLLPMARDAGVRVTLRLTGHHDRYMRDGNFDLEMWKSQLARWEGSGIQPFIDDGTLVGHMILDDILEFPGADPTGEQLDEMARASKAVLPGLMTYVRQRASDLPDREYRWLDAAVNQYRARDGDPAAYARREVEAAARRKLGVINGLNLPDGGDGTSGQAGWRAERFAMTADEIRRYGTPLADAPGLGMFLIWEYDGEERWTDGSIGADYLRRPDVEAALAELGARVASRPGVRLLKP